MPKNVLDIKTQTILDDYGKYFREFPDVGVIEPEPFSLWFNAFAHPKLNEEQKAYYAGVIQEITQPVSKDLEEGLMARIVALETANTMTAIAEKFSAGEEIDIGAELRSLVERYELDTNRKVKTPWVRDPIEGLLQDDEDDRGFHWRLEELNLSMRPLRPGDFLIVAARPDVGKTTFLTDQLTHFASQVDELFPGEDRSILWFNNEGPGKRIVTRLYQSALADTMSGLVKRSNNRTIREDYLAATGGREDTIRVFDIHDFWNHEVEDVIRATPPAMVVFDMVDNIRFGGLAANNGQRTDQLLEAMYQWARVIGVKHDCPVLATSQISADGENLCYPGLGMLKDSKTGKQGAADAILTIGYRSDFPNSRYLGMTKNKLVREGQPKSPKVEVYFDGSRARYVTPQEFNHADDPPAANEGAASADPTGGI